MLSTEILSTEILSTISQDVARPAEDGEDDVGGETQKGGQRDRDTDSSGPERAVVAVIVELQSAAHHHQEARQTSG